MQDFKPETNDHYYTIKETIVDIHNSIEDSILKYRFNRDSMYNNKIQGRIFWDRIIEETTVSQFETNKESVTFEFYLVRILDSKEEQLFLINSNGVENIKNKKLESSFCLLQTVILRKKFSQMKMKFIRKTVS